MSTQIVILVAAALLQSAGGKSPSIVFVCEHGAAKSVIATAYFNKLAAERGLPYRAIFRGTTPQDELSVRAVAGLKADGVAIPEGKPTAIGDNDIDGGRRAMAVAVGHRVAEAIAADESGPRRVGRRRPRQCHFAVCGLCKAGDHECVAIGIFIIGHQIK